jgi:hypothetical protein
MKVYNNQQKCESQSTQIVVRALEAAALRIPEQVEQGEPAEHG